MGRDTPTRGRPRGFDEEEALEAAMLTFWEKGYRATSMDDLVARTGAPRASLYKTFGDKRALFIKSLDLYGSRFEARAEGVIAEEPDMRKVFEKILTASALRLSGSEAPAGCLRCNSTLELMGSQEALDAALKEANDRFLGVMQRIIDRGVAAEQISAEGAAGLPLFFTGAISGMVSLARSGAGRDDLLAFVETTLSVLPARKAPEKRA